MRGATSTLTFKNKALEKISIHAPREGGDEAGSGSAVRKTVFQSTPPARGATNDIPPGAVLYRLFQSTPPARGATYHGGSPHAAHHDFNPRPPRGGRLTYFVPSLATIIFQSTPPARGATSRFGRILAFEIFQSTPPARGATDNQIRRLHKQKHFNPRPREGGDIVDKLLSDMRKIISIHAPREGGDDHRGKDLPCRSPISIHAPREGGDAAGRSYIPHQAISIHAPREGGDAGPVLVLCVQRNFNPRPPRGGRPQGRYARQHL